MTQEKLDKMVDKLNATINKALDKVCPLTKTKIINKNNPWWNVQLEELRKELFCIYDKTKKGTETRDTYNGKLRRYKNLCIKEQKINKNRIQEMTKTEEEMAKHVNSLSDINAPKVTTFKTPVSYTHLTLPTIYSV